jgi:hypothetical protein
MSCCRVPLWDLRPDISSCWYVAVWNFCCLVSAGRPLWREDGSAVCSAITQWSKSRRTCNHILLSHLRLPQPGRPGSCIFIPQEQGGLVIPPGIGFPLCPFCDSQGYSGGILTLSQPPLRSSKLFYNWRSVSQYVLVSSTLAGLATIYYWTWSNVTMDGRSVSMTWRPAHCGTCDQILILSKFCCLVSVGRPLWQEVRSVSCQ